MNSRRETIKTREKEREEGRKRGIGFSIPCRATITQWSAVRSLRSPNLVRLQRIIARDIRRLDTSLKLAAKKSREEKGNIAAAAYGGFVTRHTEYNGTGEKQVIFERNRNSIKDFIAAV